MLLHLTCYYIVSYHILLCGYISHISMLLHLTCYYVVTSHILLCCYVSHVTMKHCVICGRILKPNIEQIIRRNGRMMDRRIAVSACRVRALLVDQCYTYP